MTPPLISISHPHGANVRQLPMIPRHFVNMGLGFGAAALGAAGEIAKVIQVFQPSGRFSAANSL